MSDEPTRPTFLGRTIAHRTLSRRAVLGAPPAVAGAFFVAGCTVDGDRGAASSSPRPPSNIEAPHRPPLPPDAPPQEYRFFTPQEAVTVAAITARIMPGTDDDPGAVQAGVPFYIDGKLSQFDGHAEPTFTRGPFARAYSGPEAPEPAPDVVWVHEDHLYRYGFQSSADPQQIYREGLAALDLVSEARFGAPFADLTEEQQDDVLLVLEAVGTREEAVPDSDNVNDPDGGGSDGNDEDDDTGEDEEVPEALLDGAEEIFGDLSPGLFFSTVRQDTIEGMFGDPAYGGNRGMVGWLLIGYPGSQRSYSPAEMLAGTDKRPQPMHLLTPMNPDRAGGGRPALEQREHLRGT